MDLNARVDVNCGQKDRWTDGLTDRRMENRRPISHLAKAGATKMGKIGSLDHLQPFKCTEKTDQKGQLPRMICVHLDDMPLCCFCLVTAYMNVLTSKGGHCDLELFA